ncbi:hypothetical protein BJP34_11770 [Moorena producens PAL-8-15-08-1]|uniref:Uncharacterized protein n=1 Tax=Moorena producens PAL-8-15-08-1 TaxID=1458985 RepID=A0A1D8TR13_9CYAN|nr:hypothetical protein BJP34_11770 [Moorena producens PAL-8-15-08-1]
MFLGSREQGVGNFGSGNFGSGNREERRDNSEAIHQDRKKIMYTSQIGREHVKFVIRYIDPP